MNVTEISKLQKKCTCFQIFNQKPYDKYDQIKIVNTNLLLKI